VEVYTTGVSTRGSVVVGLTWALEMTEWTNRASGSVWKFREGLEFGTRDFQSGVDSRGCRLFGGICVLPLGLVERVHAALARAVGLANGPSGLSTCSPHRTHPPTASVVLGGICLERSILRVWEYIFTRME